MNFVMKLKSLLAHIVVITVFISVFSVVALDDSYANASVKAPGRVTRVALDQGGTQVCEWIPQSEAFSDIPWNKRTIVSISREVLLTWKKVKGADGYKIYMSTKSAKKGYKLVKKLNNNYGESYIAYKGAKKAQVWFKIRAFKNNGKRLKYGKYSKPFSVVLLQRPIVTSVKGQNDSVTVKWKKVYGAKKYEVLYATSSDVSAYRKQYNKTHKRQLPAQHEDAFLPVAKKIETKGTSCIITLPKEGNYFIHVRAVRGKHKSEVGYDYVYYDWETE